MPESMREFLKDLPSDKLKINWNKNPIKMDLFLSFITVDTVKSTDHLGCDMGWTQRTGDNGLVISGGIVGGVEYLDSLKYGKTLDNDYNNFVNPFYLFEILNDNGKEFFRQYYSCEVSYLLKNATDNIMRFKAALKRAKEQRSEVVSFWEEMGVSESQLKLTQGNQ